MHPFFSARTLPACLPAHPPTRWPAAPAAPTHPLHLPACPLLICPAGVLLYVILAGCLPFDEDDLVALFHKISAAQYEVPPWLSPDAVGLLRSMMSPEPGDRWGSGCC